jgi:tetratricopeptide (TPR) repeat protein
MAEKTKTDRTLDWIKDHKILSVVIVIGIIIIAIGTFTNSLQTILNLFFPSKTPTPIVNVQLPGSEPKKCELDSLMKVKEKLFKNPKSTKILIAVFEGGREQAKEFGTDISMSIADRLDEYCKDSLGLSVEDIEPVRLNCFVQSHSQAREILDSLGADIFIWGNNFCSPGSEKAKFCPKATLARRFLPFEARGNCIVVKEQLAITDLDLPSLTAEEPYQLLNFIFGLHFFRRDKFKEAGIYFEKAGDEIYSNEKGIEHIYDYLACTYQFLSKNDKALKYYEKSLRIFEAIGNRQGQGVTLNNIGEIYRAWGKYDQAIEYYKKSLRMSQEVEDRRGQGITLSNIGLVYYTGGNYDEALQYYNESLKVFEELGHLQGQGRTLNNIGELHRMRGNLNQAIYYYEKSLDLAEHVGDRQGEGITFNNIGQIYQAWGRWGSAVDYYMKSLKIAEEIGDRRQEGVTLNNIGMIYDAWGKYDQAIDYISKSSRIFEEIDAVEAKTVKENLKRIQEKMKKR